jgi:CRISPR-associated protein Csb1
MTTPNLEELLTAEGPTCLVIHTWLEPVAGLNRFQPAGFPEVGHVLYDAPHAKDGLQRVCIIDSPASMANHLETVCLTGPHDTTLHSDLAGLPVRHLRHGPPVSSRERHDYPRLP